MPTRLRKTRKLRSSRTHGWGQVAQHRASGHKGGLGVSGLLKHHYSTMLRDDPNHFGHDSTHPPYSNDSRKWASVRDLDDLFARHGRTEGDKKTIDLKSGEYDKLLGGGSIANAYTVIIDAATKSAAQKIRDAGGEIKLLKKITNLDFDDTSSTISTSDKDSDLKNTIKSDSDSTKDVTVPNNG